MFRIAICDDNKTFLSRELDLIASYLDPLKVKYKVDVFQSGVDLVQTEQLSSFDLFLLDYEMEGLNGFETAKVIREKAPKSCIAFVTVYYEFSREGYKYDAIRYLIKHEMSFEMELQGCLERALQIKNSRSNDPKLLEFGNKSLKVNPESVVYIQTSKHYLLYYILEKSIVTCYKKRGKIDSVLKELGNANYFLAIRTGILVNLKYVRSIDRKGFINIIAGSNFTKLIRISDSYKTDFINGYMKYLGDKS